MSLKFELLISLLFLFGYSHFSNSISEEEVSIKNLKIFKILAVLEEFAEKERVFFLFQTEKIPHLEGISSITIKSKDPLYEKIFTLETKCVQSDVVSNDLISICCDMKFGEVPFGDYDVINLRYFDENIKQNYVLNIKEKNKKIVEKFIKEVESKVIEGGKFEIHYEDFDCIAARYIILEDENNIKRKIETFSTCDDEQYPNWGYFQKFPLNEYVYPGKYKIIGMENLERIIFKQKKDKKKEFFIEIIEDIQILTNIYGEAYKEKEIMLILEFDNGAILKNNGLTNIYLEDTKTGQIFDPKFVNLDSTPGNEYKQRQMMFNFRDIPVGNYYMNYIYKKRKYEKIQSISIKERDTVPYRMLKGRCNILKGEVNQNCVFSFYSEGYKVTNLDYLLIPGLIKDDKNSKIYPKDCKIISENIEEAEYTLRCIIDIYIKDSKYYNYYLKEYKINGNIFTSENYLPNSRIGPYRFNIKN